MRKQEILHQALRLFCENGYNQVSIRDIARNVGCGESGIYRHFASKEQLAVKVFEDAYTPFADRLRSAMEGRDSFAEVVAAIIDTIYAAFDADPVLLRFLVLRQHEGIPAAQLGQNNPVPVVLEAIERAVEHGEIPSLACEPALAILMGIVLQPLTNSLYGRLPMPISPLAPVIAAAALRALDVAGDSQ